MYWKRQKSCSIVQKKQLCFYCRIMLLALHIALIYSTNLCFDQVHFKQKRPQVLSSDSHETVGAIHHT